MWGAPERTSCEAATGGHLGIQSLGDNKAALLGKAVSWALLKKLHDGFSLMKGRVSRFSTPAKRARAIIAKSSEIRKRLMLVLNYFTPKHRSSEFPVPPEDVDPQHRKLLRKNSEIQKKINEINEFEILRRV